MTFIVNENSPNGTVVGVAPAGSSISPSSNDRNGNKIPAFTIGADNIIRVSDSSELDFERLFADQTYQILVAKEGRDDVLSISVRDELIERFAGTPGNDLLRSFDWGEVTLLGLGGNDQLTGSFRNDVLIGGAGSDTLTGGQGSDLFVFDESPQSGTDTITDFVAGIREESDRIALHNDAFTRLRTQKFSFQTVEGVRAARRSRALFVYDLKSNGLFYNSNGSAAGFGRDGGKFAQFSGGLTPSAESFIIQD